MFIEETNHSHSPEGSQSDERIYKANSLPLNIIGEHYYNSDEIIKAHFIDVAEKKALSNGSEQKRFRRIWQETHAYLPIANVYTYFLHAAHEVYGLNFDFRVQARSEKSKTVTTTHEVKTIAVTIETL